MIEKIVNIYVTKEEKEVLKNAIEIIEGLALEDEDALDDFIYNVTSLDITSNDLLEGLADLVNATEIILG